MISFRSTVAAAALVGALASSTALAGQIVVDAGRGPVTVHLPSDYDPARPIPLVVLLHGYSATGPVQESYFGLLPLAEEHGFLYAFPTGTIDPVGNPFWNATDACCDLFGSGVDDSGYLVDLVGVIRDELSVDPWRVHFVGHSNGGFMSYRMACDHADVVASIGSLAGATWFDSADCDPLGSVNVLQIHGTFDGTIFYNGGSIAGIPYPGAVRTVETWAGYDGCDIVPDFSAAPRDLDAGIPGDESTVRRYPDGCVPAGAAELWTIVGGGHVPALTAGFRQGLVGFVLGHPKAGLVFSDVQTLTWPALRWAQTYRVLRGDLADLFDDNGDGLPDPGYGDCISAADPDPTDTTLTVADDPRPGEGFFYVVGFVDDQGKRSIFGTTSDGLPRTTTVTCP